MLADDLLQPRVREDLDPVVGEDARRVLVPLVADDLGKVLDEVAAAGDVQDLAPAADGQHGHVARERALEERELGAVALGPYAVRLRVRLGAVGVGVEVGAAGEDEPVEGVERLLDALGAGRHEQRPPAGALDRLHVRERDERGRELPDAPARLLRVARDPDDRTHRYEST